MNEYNSQYMQLKIDKLEQIINKEKSVNLVSEEMNVSRQSVSKWLNRYKRFGVDGLLHKKKTGCKVAHNKTSEEVELLVVELARKYWIDGCETLHDHLMRDHNIELNQSTIYRILKRQGVRYTDKQPRTRKRWKKQLFSHQIPGTELQMDTKYPFGYKQGRVIYTVIDDCSRWVYAYSYSTANAENTLDFIQRLQRLAPFPIVKIRTDNGKEFIATRIRDYLHSQHIEHRTNTPYCPEENGKIERFHRTLNEKLLVPSCSPNHSLDLLQYKVELFLDYYNTKKRHRGLGMNGLTPLQKLQQCADVNLTLQCYMV